MKTIGLATLAVTVILLSACSSPINDARHAAAPTADDTTASQEQQTPTGSSTPTMVPDTTGTFGPNDLDDSEKERGTPKTYRVFRGSHDSCSSGPQVSPLVPAYDASITVDGDKATFEVDLRSSLQDARAQGKSDYDYLVDFFIGSPTAIGEGVYANSAPGMLIHVQLAWDGFWGSYTSTSSDGVGQMKQGSEPFGNSDIKKYALEFTAPHLGSAFVDTPAWYASTYVSNSTDVVPSLFCPK